MTEVVLCMYIIYGFEWLLYHFQTTVPSCVICYTLLSNEHLLWVPCHSMLLLQKCVHSGGVFLGILA
jgi:hypothetical protein